MWSSLNERRHQFENGSRIPARAGARLKSPQIQVIRDPREWPVVHDSLHDDAQDFGFDRMLFEVPAVRCYSQSERDLDEPSAG
jgi:hypothetical protein